MKAAIVARTGSVEKCILTVHFPANIVYQKKNLLNFATHHSPGPPPLIYGTNSPLSHPPIPPHHLIILLMHFSTLGASPSPHPSTNFPYRRMKPETRLRADISRIAPFESISGSREMSVGYAIPPIVCMGRLRGWRTARNRGGGLARGARVWGTGNVILRIQGHDLATLGYSLMWKVTRCSVQARSLSCSLKLAP